jgi:WD40 repeat protein
MISSSSERNPVERLAEEFAARLRRGERPALSEYTAKYPQYAAQIEELFPALVIMEQLKPAEGDLSGPSGGPTAEEVPPLECLGDYRILREVGRGGMGVVYEAEQQALGRRVALKVLPRKLLADSKHRRRFEREARLAAKLHHTNIVPVFGVGEQDGLPFYVMQFIEGLGLDEVLDELQRLRAGGQPQCAAAKPPPAEGNDLSAADVARSLLTGSFPPPVADASQDQSAADLPEKSAGEKSSAAPAAGRLLSDSLVVLPGRSGPSGQRQTKPPTYWQSVAQIGVQVAGALEYAHQQGVLHRDLEPSNLLLDRRTTVWVTDFGLANGEADRARQAETKAKEGQARLQRSNYAASMQLARVAWDSHNTNDSHVRTLLEETADFPERGFEWYYWQGLCHLRTEHLTLLGHQGRVTAVAFSTDGRRLVTAGNDGTARVWDATTGRALLCLRVHRSQITSVAFARDGQWLVTGSTDGMARVWDAISGQELRKFQNQGTGPLWAVAVTPDGKRVVTGSEEGTPRILDAASGQILLTLQGPTPLPRFAASLVGWLRSWQGPLLAASVLYPGRTGHTGRVWSIAVSRDGQRLITGSGDATARIWDAATGRLLLPPLQHGAEVTAVAISTNGQMMATACGLAGEVTLWDAVSGRELQKSSGHTGRVWSVVITPDGQRIVTAGEDGLVKIWDAASGQELQKLPADLGRVPSISVSSDGQRLVTGSWNKPAKLWNAVSGQEILEFKEPASAPRSVAMTPDGQRIITGGWDGAVTLWDASSGHKLLESKERHRDEVQSIAVTRDGQRIITGGADRTARIWDMVSGRELLILKGHTKAVSSVAVTADGERIVTGSLDGTVKIWEAAAPGQLALWAKQDKETPQPPAAWRLPVAGAPGFIQDWLVLAPLKVKDDDGWSEQLEREYIPGEARLQPREGKPVLVEGQEWTWQAHHGEEVYKHMLPEWFGALERAGPVTLRKGTNVLVFKTVNACGVWLGCARFVDEEGNPVPGLQVRLTPE